MPIWTGAENLAPPGFDPWTVQPVASRYRLCHSGHNNTNNNNNNNNNNNLTVQVVQYKQQ